jgi:hypothetical protein
MVFAHNCYCMQYKSIGFFSPIALLLVQDVSCRAHIDLSHIVEVMLCTFLACNWTPSMSITSQKLGSKVHLGIVHLF